jgi:hypothetical protein
MDGNVLVGGMKRAGEIVNGGSAASKNSAGRLKFSSSTKSQTELTV